MVLLKDNAAVFVGGISMGLWDLFQQGQINGLDDQVQALVEQVTRLSEASLELTRQVKDLSDRVAELERMKAG